MRVFALLVGALLISGCTPATPAQEIPDTPVGRQLSWWLGAIERHPIPAADIAEHFAPHFVEEIPEPEINRVSADFPDPEFTIRRATDVKIMGDMRDSWGVLWRVTLGVDADGLIDILLVVEP